MNNKNQLKDSSELEAKIKSLEKKLNRQKEEFTSKNKRLTEKLQSSREYAEELRIKVESLNKKLWRFKKEKKSKDCQTDESDLKEALYLWNLASDKDSKNDPDGTEDNLGNVIVNQIREAAEEEAHKQFLEGMAFEKTSGLYYDYKTGYYYDADRRLYYNGSSGTYYKYNYETNEYEIHSQIPTLSSKNDKTTKTKSKKSLKRTRNGETKENYESDCEKTSDVEEGEVDSSDNESSVDSPSSILTSSSSDDNSNEETDENCDKNPKVSSCLRLVVLKSESIQIGTLYIVTIMGGNFGNDEKCDIQIEDVGCSKFHGKFTFKDDKYFLTDLGSRNGTYVNNKRLSCSKSESEPKEIGHGSLLHIGTTQMACHVHPGKETCFECEPGLTLKPKEKIYKPEPKMESKRKKELKKMKIKYGLNAKDYSNNDSDSSYNNRAEKRRCEVGSDNPYEKTDSAHVDKQISTSNKGFKLLSKMGWKAGEGLGKESDGRIEPVKAEIYSDRSGLGTTTTSSISNVPFDFKVDQTKLEILKKTRERYENTKEKS